MIMQSNLFSEVCDDAEELKRDHALLYISIGVLLAHFLLLFWLNYFSSYTLISEPVKRIIVQTVHFKSADIPQKPIPNVQQEPIQQPVLEKLNQEELTQPKSLEPPSELREIEEEFPEEPIQQEAPKIEEQIPEKNIPKPEVKAPTKVEVEKHPPKVDKKAATKPTPKSTPAKKPPVKTTPNKTPKLTAKTAQKQPEKPIAKKETTSSKVDPQAEIARKKRIALLNSAQEKIAKIGETRDKIGATQKNNLVATATPSLLGSLTIDSIADQEGNEVGAREMSYRDELAQRLKIQLKLPEHGEVRIKLTLDRSGRFVKIAVVSSGSKKNQAYIEKTIPTLTYPGFGDRFGTSKDYTFVISLNNDL